MAGFVYGLRHQLAHVGRVIMKPLTNYSDDHDGGKLQLVIVMVIVPLILNAIQLWVQDTFLKAKDDNLLANCCSCLPAKWRRRSAKSQPTTVSNPALQQTLLLDDYGGEL